MADNNVLFRQRAVIEFLVKEEISTANIHHRLQRLYGAMYMGASSDRRRVEHFNPLNPKLNPICYLLALLGAHHFLHVSRRRVKSLTLRLHIYIYIYIYIYGAPILDVSRSHTTTQHSR